MSNAPAEVRYGSGSRGRVSLNARSSRRGWLTVSLLLVLSLLAASLLLLAQPAFVHAEETVRPIFTVTKPTYLPYLGQFAPKPPLPLEVRALWISRFDLGNPPVTQARLEALGHGGRFELQAVPAPRVRRGRTRESARALQAEWKLERGAFNLASDGLHARRSWRAFRDEFGDGVEVGSVALTPAAYDGSDWWSCSEGVRAMIGEAVAYLYDLF